jgi:glycosyltransferase involved in cell wall biosynthesis
VSAHLADYVRQTLGIDRTVVVPNGSDPELFRPDAQVVKRLADKGAAAFNVLWMGSAYIGWHNFELLRDAAAIIWRNGNRHDITFHLMGERMGSMGDMPPNVVYQGAEAYEKLSGWLSGMDAGLCLYRPGPADYSSPLKVFDYMASGLAVVATDQPQVRGIFAELGQTDMLVAPDDAARLASTLEGLAADRARVAEMGRKGRELLITRYTWTRAAADALAATQAVVDERAARHGR